MGWGAIRIITGVARKRAATRHYFKRGSDQCGTWHG
jgi:hypothetical protein